MANNIENFVINVATRGADGLKTLGNGITDVSNKVGGLTTALAAVGFGAFLKNAMASADALVDLSKATGISVVNIKAMESALELAGGKAQDTGKVINTLYANIENANDGSEKLQSAFGKVGVSLNDLKNASEQDILDKAIKGLSTMEEGSERTNLAVQIFGRSMRSVDPADFAKRLEQMKGEFAGTEDAIMATANAQGMLDDSMRAFTDAAIINLGKIVGIFGDTGISAKQADTAVKVLGVTVGLIFGAKAIASAMAFVKLMKEWQVISKGQLIIQTALTALQGPKGWAIMAAGAAAAGVAIYGLNELLDDTEEKGKKAINAINADTTGKPGKPANRTQVVKKDEEARKKAEREAEAAAERLKKQQDDATKEIAKQVAEYQRSIDIMVARNELERELVGFTTTAGEEKRKMFDMEQERLTQIATINAQIYATELQKTAAIDSVNKKYQEGLQTIELDTAKRLAGVYAVKNRNEELFTRLIDLRAQDLLSEEEYQAARMALILETNAAIYESERKRFEDKKLLELQSQENSMFGYETQKEMARKATEFQMKSETEKRDWAISQAGDALNSLGTMNKKAFEAAKAFNIAQAIMNTYMGATKALATYPPPFNFIAAAAVVASGMAQVANIKSQSYSGKALGGPVNATSAYMVGENGPEVFVPKTSGNIVRNEDLGKMGRGSQEQQQPQITNVSYSIQAVDASSFRSLLASDPEFIHSVAERGRNRSPSRMR
jgi:hypothetical protein